MSKRLIAAITPDAMSEPAAFSAMVFAEVSASRMIALLGFDEFS
jgi:hypothetical protein